VLELGHNSLPLVEPLLDSARWTNVGVTKDLAGIPRVIAAETRLTIGRISSESRSARVGLAEMPELARFRAKHGAAGGAGGGCCCRGSFMWTMDAFFVSVELLERPELRGKPVVVGGRADQRGVVTAASYEARKYGIQSAMPLRTAGKLWPACGFSRRASSTNIRNGATGVARILAKFTPVVEMVSIDEAYLDFSGTQRLYGPPLAAADKLLRTITAETGLPCSAGLAATRLVAKVASDQGKPARTDLGSCGR